VQAGYAACQMITLPTGTTVAWTDQIYSYCERGQSGAFWAEPFNAVSNGAFILAAIAAAMVWTRQPATRRGMSELALTGLVAVIGTGSFLFHTFATRWSAIADVAPIGLFMVAYLAYALRRYLGFGWIGAGAGLLAFAALTQAAFAAPCPAVLEGLVRGGRCLNGSIGYLPAFAMLLAVGIAAGVRRHAAAPYLLASAGVFALSLTARSLDLEVCSASRILGQVRGTHAVWHTLNAVTLVVLLLAAVRHGPAGGRA
jgi:Ceramidase